MANEIKPRSVNVRRIFLNARQQIGIYEMCAKYKISEKSAILLTLSKGLNAEGFMNEEQFKKDYENYGKPLVEKVEQNKQTREILEKGKKESENVLLNAKIAELRESIAYAERKNLPELKASYEKQLAKALEDLKRA